MKKSLERILFMCVGGMLVLLGGMFLPQGKQVNAQNTNEQVFGTIICRELKVVDAFGEVRAGIGSDADGGFVTVGSKDKIGRPTPVITLTENEYGGSIFVMGKDGKSAASLSIQEGLPGKFGGIVIVKNNEFPRNTLTRNTLNGTAYIYAGEYGGGLAINNNAGKNVGMFGATDIGGCQLLTKDKYGNMTGNVP